MITDNVFENSTNVPTSWLLRFRGNKLRESIILQEGDREFIHGTIYDMADKLEQEGFTEPLILVVGIKDKKAYVSEGNHRMIAARMACIDYVPVTCIIVEYAKRGINVSKELSKNHAGMEINKNHAPADVFIKICKK